MAFWHILYDSLSWLFDNPLYIYMIAVYGPVKGGAVMTIASLVLCFAWLTYYQWKKVPWAGENVLDALREQGIEYAEKLKKNGFKSFFRQIFFFLPAKMFIFGMWLMKRYGDIAAFFVLSVFEDPFYTTVYLRHGRFDGLRKKDYLVFFSSVLVSNGYWILRNWGLIEAVRFIWRAIVHLFA